ncbi:ATP-binding cassette domain-containing protein [Streptomyces sp. NBC_01092]|uniref:ATP-binding cassette domain-containing protein n=1 Tax=Streptomyces sp. NBC_01092 TaxID=2903748 RepID=UPI003865EABF|nr:ATP-binding cassette domain-containing protein [Streptomyces sp. NBC_01092]
MSTIEIADLTKAYGKKRVVDGLSFTVRPGSVTGFLGPNGAGKSTTLRMTLGLTRPDSGTARIQGRSYHEHAEPLRVVGALLDARWAHPKRSARAHLTWLAHSNRIPVGRVDEVLSRVGLTEVADQRVGGFSLGMAQRLGLAGALLGDPGILILDEPANGLDPEGIAWMRGLLRQLAAEGRSVLVSSHLLAEMAQLADEVVVIGRGQLIKQCSIAELTSVGAATQGEVVVRGPEPGRLRELLTQAGATVDAGGPGTDPSAPPLLVSGLSCEDIGRAVAGAGLVLYELTPRRGTVEDAYLQLTGTSVEYRGSVRPAEERAV